MLRLNLAGNRFRIIAERHSRFSSRASFRFKTKRRPFTYSFTISRYVSRKEKI